MRVLKCVLGGPQTPGKDITTLSRNVGSKYQVTRHHIPEEPIRHKYFHMACIVAD